jgi:hypothetical protein
VIRRFGKRRLAWRHLVGSTHVLGSPVQWCEFCQAISTTSVISRLEDAEYDGHLLVMLRRIARALDKRVEIRFVLL